MKWQEPFHPRVRVSSLKKALSGGESLRNGRIDTTEKAACLVTGQLSIRIDFAAHKALAHEHVLERIGLIDELATTFLAAGSCHGSLLSRR